MDEKNAYVVLADNAPVEIVILARGVLLYGAVGSLAEFDEALPKSLLLRTNPLAAGVEIASGVDGEVKKVNGAA